MKKILVLFFMLLGICGCSTNKNNDIDKIMSENEYVIIDVRTKEEYDEGHVVNSINIPYDEITEDIDIDKENIIFVYCKSGNRSSKAYDILTNLGYTVYDLGAYSDIKLEKNN